MDKNAQTPQNRIDQILDPEFDYMDMMDRGASIYEMQVQAVSDFGTALKQRDMMPSADFQLVQNKVSAACGKMIHENNFEKNRNHLISSMQVNGKYQAAKSAYSNDSTKSPYYSAAHIGFTDKLATLSQNGHRGMAAELAGQAVGDVRMGPKYAQLVKTQDAETGAPKLGVEFRTARPLGNPMRFAPQAPTPGSSPMGRKVRNGVEEIDTKAVQRMMQQQMKTGGLG